MINSQTCDAPRLMEETCGPTLSPELARVILSAAKLIGHSLDPLVSIGGILRLLSEQLALVAGRVILPDGEGTLRVAYCYGLSKEEARKGVYELGEGVTGRVMQTGEIALIPDVAKEPLFLSRIVSPIDAASHQLSYIAVPILHQDTALGVLAVQRYGAKDDQFTGDLYVLQIMAAMIGQVLRIQGLVAEHTRRLEQENAHLRRLKHIEGGAVHGIVGSSSALRRAVEEARKAAASQATVLLIGESGTGKERFARMIHLASSRQDQPFVCINCAAIPPQLLEAELFGYEKGSFTGATAARAGKFEVASGGTLFLDEIGDMPPDLQAKLLRVLQEKAIQRLGAGREIPVDVRIISATNKQLEEAVKTGQFRLDLYYRLNVIPILLPPLRERQGDIELLALYFLARYNQQQRRNVVLSPAALKRLTEYDWPGNVRQLENVVERLVIMTDGDLLDVKELESALQTESSLRVHDLRGERRDASAAMQTARPYCRVDGSERERIIAALRDTKGNKTDAARRLDMSPRQLHYRLSKLKIEA